MGESTTIFKNPLIWPLLDALLKNPFSHNASLLEALLIKWRQPSASWRNMLLTQPRMAPPLEWHEQLPFQKRLHIPGPSSPIFSRSPFTARRPKTGFVESADSPKRLGAILDELESEITSQKAEAVAIEIPNFSDMRVLEYNEQLWTIEIEREYDY